MADLPIYFQEQLAELAMTDAIMGRLWGSTTALRDRSALAFERARCAESDDVTWPTPEASRIITYWVAYAKGRLLL